MEFLKYLDDMLAKGDITPPVYTNFTLLYNSFYEALKDTRGNISFHEPVFKDFLDKVKEQIESPYPFAPYHEKVTHPFNYYNLGIDFVRPLVDDSTSLILKPENIDRMEEQVKNHENVILFANHQTEVDPQLLSYILEKGHNKLGSDLIFVAGDRVVTDPMAVPFSIGRNLLCIYSKRHINNPPEKKVTKQHHNQKVMRRLAELFAIGGKCVFVAPSGGRDRPNEYGEVVPAPFDPDSIEMFRLMAKQGKRPAHFYPLALDTYEILPPPDTINRELGEPRVAHRDGIRFAFGDEIDMQHFPGADNKDRHQRREALAKHIWDVVNGYYQTIKKGKS